MSRPRLPRIVSSRFAAFSSRRRVRWRHAVSASAMPPTASARPDTAQGPRAAPSPKQNGYELWQALRIHWPRTQVLLVSGYTPVALDRHGIQTAGFSLVQKPVPNLVEIVARLIGPPQVV